MDGLTTKMIKTRETETKFTKQDDDVTNGIATHETRSPSASCNDFFFSDRC